MGGMQTFATAVESLCTSYKKMNPFCIPFAIQNMGQSASAGYAGWPLALPPAALVLRAHVWPALSPCAALLLTPSAGSPTVPATR